MPSLCHEFTHPLTRPQREDRGARRDVVSRHWVTTVVSSPETSEQLTAAARLPVEEHGLLEETERRMIVPNSDEPQHGAATPRLHPGSLAAGWRIATLGCDPAVVDDEGTP